jgi:hypothetical protein
MSSSQGLFFIFFIGTTAPVGLGLPPWNSPFHFFFFPNLTQSVGLLGRVISSSQGLYLYTNAEKRTHTNTKHPRPEWDSNPRSRLPSKRRQYMPQIPRLPWPAIKGNTKGKNCDLFHDILEFAWRRISRSQKTSRHLDLWSEVSMKPSSTISVYMWMRKDVRWEGNKI